MPRVMKPVKRGRKPVTGGGQTPIKRGRKPITGKPAMAPKAAPIAQGQKPTK